MDKNLFITGCLFAVTAVILGALGAHALKEKLSPEQLISFETGVRYQFFHAIAILLVAANYEKFNSSLIIWSKRFFIAGIFCFSGSIYLLSMKEILHTDVISKILGPITPLGGIFFILGWIFLMLSVIKIKK